MFHNRINGYIEILDTTISRIRTAVYDVDITPDRPPSLQDRILADDVVAAVREALTTVAGHAGTTRAELRVDIAGDVITIENIDDGTSRVPPARAGATTESRRHTSSLKQATATDGDTHLTWTARIPADH